MTNAWDVDACRVVRDLLCSWGYEDATLRRLDELTGKEGIVVRELPATTVHEELDGSHVDDFPIHVVVRRRSEEQARRECRSIEFMLDGMPLRSANGSYSWISTRVYTHSQQLPLDEANFYAYDLRITVQMEIERN